MSEETGLVEIKERDVVPFAYPDPGTRMVCEGAAARIDEVNDARVRMNVAARLEIGRQLNVVCHKLPHGMFGPWLAWRFPDWSQPEINRWRTFAQRYDSIAACDYDKSAQIEQILHKFKSTTAAMEFLGLPERVQRKVVEAGAWTWGAYRAVCWDDAMRERLEDGGLGFEERHGHVLHAIEDARDDRALAEVAEALYQENRDTFARLSDREPAELDVETKAPRPELPRGDAPSAQLVERDEGYWLCRRILVNGEDAFLPVARVASHILMWGNGNGEPSILAAFPEVGSAPSASWQASVVDAACRRVNASTMASVYGEVL